MEGIQPKPLQRALSKLMGQAVDEIQRAEQRQQYERLAQRQAQANKPYTQQQLYSSWTTTTAGSTTSFNTQLGGGLNGPYSSGYAQQTYALPKLSLTDEQMSLLMEKLAHLMAKGWECLRCHRIWSPQVSGCEFCNFIDRLEGKDVERDSAA